MPPKRKRKTQGSYPRKKKDQQPPKQNQEEEQEEELLMRTPSGSSSDHDDDDDVCLISPPPNFKSNSSSSSAITISSSGKKRGRRGRQFPAHTAKDIDFVKSTMELLLLPDAHSCDLRKHEALFQKLGLFEFASNEFRLEDRVDLLAELVVTYDPVSHSSVVRGLRIRVSRADLAKALRIPYKKEKNSVAVEVPDFEGPPGYLIGNCSAEGIRTVLKFVSTRVLPCDDPNFTWAEMVPMVENALKLEHSVDWASLIWSRAEREIRQGKGLGKFYYGCHFLELIRSQRPSLLEKESVKVENEEESFVPRTRSLEDLDGDDLGVQGNQEEGLKENGEIGKNEGKNVNEEEQKDVVMEQQREENNTVGNEITRDDGSEKHGDGGLLVEGTIRPYSTGVAEKNGDDAGGKDIEEVQSESEKVVKDIEVVQSESEKVSKDTEEVQRESEKVVKDIEEVRSESEKVEGFMEVDSQDAHLEALTEADNNALSELERGEAANNLLSELERGEAANNALSELETGEAANNAFSELQRGEASNLDDACLDSPKLSLQRPLPGFENGGIAASDTHLEEPIEEEAQFIKGGKDMVFTSTTHIEKPTSAEQMMTEVVEGVALSENGLLQRSSTAAAGHMMMAEIEKDMTLGLGMNLQRPAGNVFQIMSQGASHSDSVRKRDMEEENELNGDTGKKPRTDIPLSFDICMANLYDWTRRAEASYVNEKEMLINGANMQIEHLTQQLQQRDFLIRNLQMGKQEDQHREMEVNKLKSEFFLTNKTFLGYVKAVEDARDTIQQLREIIRQQNGTIESLKEQHLAEYRHVKEQITQLSNYMKETFDNLNTDVDKQMEQQARLEEKFEMIKEEMQKKHSDTPA